MGLKEILRNVWNFLWKSNSVWSWIADIVLIFLIVKFVIFPLFSLLLSTKLPFVIIESGSMEHKIVSHYKGLMPNICGLTFPYKKNLEFDEYWNYCGSWYEKNNITKEEFRKWPFSNGLDKGDIIVVKGLKNHDYKKGDIIIFVKEESSLPIIHRIVNVKVRNNKRYFSTKGDHNARQLSYEKEIREEQVIGKAWLRIPKLGWLKLFFVEIFKK